MTEIIYQNQLKSTSTNKIYVIMVEEKQIRIREWSLEIDTVIY